MSKLMDRSWSRQAFPGRLETSVLLKLSLRWWADIQAEISTRHEEMNVTTWVSEGEGEKYSSIRIQSLPRFASRSYKILLDP